MIRRWMWRIENLIDPDRITLTYDPREEFDPWEAAVVVEDKWVSVKGDTPGLALKGLTRKVRGIALAKEDE